MFAKQPRPSREDFKTDKPRVTLLVSLETELSNASTGGEDESREKSSFTGANHPAQDVAASLDQLAVLLVDDQKNNRNAVSTVEVPAHVIAVSSEKLGS
jgi:hypothetical protein